MSDPALALSVHAYSIGLFPLFEQIGYDASKSLAEKAESYSSENPLHLCGDRKFDMPVIGQCSGAKLIAVMSSFLVWSQRKQGFPLPTSTLLSASNEAYELWKRTSQQSSTP